VIPLKDETTQAYQDRVNRNMNYMMPDYNVKMALSFSYSSGLINMYEQLREENAIWRSKAREAHIHEQNMIGAQNKIKTLKVKSRARKIRIQELHEELENRTQMVQHLQGQLQQAHELIEDIQAQVQAVAEMEAEVAEEESEEEEEEEDPEEIEGVSGVESRPGTP